MKDIILKHQAVEYGICDAASFPESKERLFKLCANARRIIVCLFPYYCDSNDGNISKYARGLDYHIVLKDRLSSICVELGSKYQGSRFMPFFDSSVLSEVKAARLSGVAMTGKNHLAINEKYGSFIFLGCIVTDYPFDVSPSLSACKECNLCINACPTGALSTGDFSRCLSHITQKKGEFSPDEQIAVKNAQYSWGCDICQDVCPYNKSIPVTDIFEFKNNLVYYLKYNDVENDDYFKSNFSDRAFSWRGNRVLMRNLKLKED